MCFSGRPSDWLLFAGQYDLLSVPSWHTFGVHSISCRVWCTAAGGVAPSPCKTILPSTQLSVPADRLVPIHHRLQRLSVRTDTNDVAFALDRGPRGGVRFSPI